MTHNSAIFRGTVVHKRLRPKQHRLQYNVFALLIDLEELPKLNRLGTLFGYNRPAILSFYDKDHGPTTGTALRPWVESRLREAGLELDGGTIELLCYPRILGYVFNPLSVYFCYRANGNLNAILYEVCNTFNERHVYVIGVDNNDQAVIKQSCKKMLYVSPFMEMSATYHFRVMPPGDRLNITIRQEDADGLLFAAAFSGTRTSLTRGTLARCLLAFPLLTVKVIAAIHWEALLLWAKGLRVFPHTPAARPVDSSVGQLDKN